MLTCLIFACIFHISCGQGYDSTAVNQPVSAYPGSDFITGIVFDMSTLKNACPGNNLKADRSDNWTITWADDGHQYASWGDGGGFGGTNEDGRVSMGMARIEGDKENYSCFNVWGGKNPESRAGTFPGKSYGIISIHGILYLWRSGIESVCYGLQELWKSIDHGRNWIPADVRWSFPENEFTGFFVPTFLQFGKDYAGARDEYVYSYATEHTASVNPDDTWAVNRPGYIILMRVPVTEMEDQEAYEFFSGMDSAGSPLWSGNINKRKPVFEDVMNGVMRSSVIWDPGLERYIMVTQHVTRFRDLRGKKGHIGIYESPEPWGPWSTILFAHPWDIGDEPHLQNASFPGDAKTVYYNFSPKWWSGDGKKFVMVYTGPGGDQWGTVEGRFLVREENK